MVADEDTLNGIITASDGVMVARGDLGVEVGDAQLIGIQKELISRARKMDRVVITATQMMESMISNSMPTRAEVFDVANAVLDGTDAVMLSAETAVGNTRSRLSSPWRTPPWGPSARRYQNLALPPGPAVYQCPGNHRHVGDLRGQPLWQCARHRLPHRVGHNATDSCRA